MKNISIAIIDDHILFAESLKILIERELGNICRVYCYYNINDFKKDKAKYHFNFILLDIQIGDDNGLVFLENNNTFFKKNENIIILSSLGNSATIRQAFQHGAKGFLSKNCDVKELLEAFETINKEETYIGKTFQRSLSKEFISKNMMPNLTPRENEVLNHLCNSLTAKEIAIKLELSTNTVQMYIKTLFSKFEVNRTTDLVIRAIKYGFNSQ